MSLKKLPEPKAFQRPANYQWDAPSGVLTKWADAPVAVAAEKDGVISIFDVIGEDWWTGGGFTSKRCAAALRSIGDKPVTVQINSPGGDMFEGIAIYNLLREHPAEVTIEVMGWAASAASIIAMAGDTIKMGLGSFMMVHNAWGCVCGNRHDMTSAAELFVQFDSAIADIYEARVSLKRAEIEKLMDDETFMAPSEAVKLGFADVVDSGLKVEARADGTETAIMAKRRLDAALAHQGISRSERRRMQSEIEGEQPPASMAAQDAGPPMAAFERLINSVRQAT